MITFLLSIPLIIVVVFFLIGFLISAPGYSGPKSDHFDGRKFINPANIKPQGLNEVVRWMLNREKGAWHYDATSPSSFKILIKR